MSVPTSVPSPWNAGTNDATAGTNASGTPGP